MSVKRHLVVLLSVFAMLLGGTAVASAENYDWPHNGCTSAPDQPAGYDFTDACNQHDGCYARHWADRSTCDFWFLRNMLKVCSRVGWTKKPGCGALAASYYAAVRQFGGIFYNSDGQLVYDRINTPVA